MKIMIFNTLYFPYRIGGAEVSVQLLAEELVRKGCTVRVVTLTEKKSRQVDILNGVEVIGIPLANVYWPFNNKKHSIVKKMFWHIFDTLNIVMYYRAIKEIRKFSPDVVHTNNISGFSVLVWKAVSKFKIKLIHTSRDYYLFHPNSTLFSHGKNISLKSMNVFFWSIIKKKYSRFVDEYIGISSFIERMHKENGFFPKAKSDVIFNAVNKIESSKSAKIKNIGFIGRLSKEKGFDVFCNIAGKYRSEFNFIAAGNFVNNDDQAILKTLAQREHVGVKGYMKLEDFLDEIDAVVLPIKWNEPFGRTVVECALAGKLVFTNPVGAMIELSTILPNIIITKDMDRDFYGEIINREIKDIDSKLVNMFKPGEIAEQYLCVYNNEIKEIA